MVLDCIVSFYINLAQATRFTHLPDYDCAGACLLEQVLGGCILNVGLEMEYFISCGIPSETIA